MDNQTAGPEDARVLWYLPLFSTDCSNARLGPLPLGPRARYLDAPSAGAEEAPTVPGNGPPGGAS